MKRTIHIAFILFIYLLPMAYAQAATEISPLNTASNLKEAHDLTFYNNMPLVLITKTDNKKYILQLDPTMQKWILYTNKIPQNTQSIHAAGSRVFVITPTALFTLSSGSLALKKLVESNAFAQNATFTHMSGASLKELFVSYKKSDGSYATKLCALIDSALEMQNDELPYRSVSSRWALKDNGNTLVSFDIFETDDEDIFDINDNEIDENKPPYRLKKSFNSLITYSNTVLARDNDNHIFSWDAKEKTFKKSNAIPAGSFVSIASKVNGTAYALQKNGILFEIPADQTKPFKKIAGVTQQPQGTVPTEATVSSPPLVKNAASFIASTSTSASQSSTPSANVRSPLQPSPPSLQKPQDRTMQQQPVTRPLSQKEREPIQETEPPTPLQQAISAVQDWQKIEKNREDPNFEIGLNLGAIQGIQENPHYTAAKKKLIASYNQGVQNGPKTCILDNTFWPLMNIPIQEAAKAFSQKGKLGIASEFFRGMRTTQPQGGSQ